MVTPGPKHPRNVINMSDHNEDCACCTPGGNEFCSPASFGTVKRPLRRRVVPAPAPAPVQTPAVEDKKESKDDQDDESVGEEDMVIVEKSDDKENVPTVRPTLKNKKKNTQKENTQEPVSEPIQSMQSLSNPLTAAEYSDDKAIPGVSTTVDSSVHNRAVKKLTSMKSAQVIIGVAIAALVLVCAVYFLIKYFSKSLTKGRKSASVEKTLA